jgi:hypothetical protein
MPETPDQRWRTCVMSDETVMVSIADVLEWLRNCETAWTGCRDDDPARVARHLGDELRDLWLDGMQHRATR